MNIETLLDRTFTITLDLCEAEGLRNENISLTRDFFQAGWTITVVTTGMPSSLLAKLYTKNGVDVGTVGFVDAITPYSLGKTPPSEDRIRYVSSPGNLTDIGIAVTSIANDVPDQSVFIFDSISTMLIYSPSPSILRFLHFLASKIRLKDSTAVFLGVGNGLDPAFISQVGTIVDNMTRE